MGRKTSQSCASRRHSWRSHILCATFPSAYDGVRYPDEEYLDPPLQGYRLSGDDYAPISVDADGFIPSIELDLWLRIESEALQFYRADRKERLLSAKERAVRAEREAAALRDELKRLRQRHPNE